MKKFSVLIFRISCYLMVVLVPYACTVLYPPTVYDGSKRRLSHYEDNYFIKVPSEYNYLRSPEELVPILPQQIQALDGKIALFNKEKQITVGVFRWQKEVDPYVWYEIIDATKNNNPPDGNHPLIRNIINQFEVGSLLSIELSTYNNFLVMAPRLDLEETHHKLKLAVQPYATYKGGPRNSLFIAFVLYIPSVMETQVHKDFENLLDNTELSYFLNYERSLDKTLTFN